MAMCDTVDHLLKDTLGCILIQVLPFLYKLKQIATISVLHDEQKVLWTLEDLE